MYSFFIVTLVWRDTPTVAYLKFRRVHILTAKCRWNPINSRELQAEMKRRNVSYEELIPCVPAGSILSRVPCSLHDGKEVPSYSVPSPDFPALPPAAGLQPL